MITRQHKAVRLFFQVIAATAVAMALIMRATPMIAPRAQGLALLIQSVAVLAIFAGPLIFWRFVTIERRSAAAINKATATLRIVQNNLVEVTKSEEEARNGEQFLRSAIDSLDAHTVVLDSDGRIVSVNKTWREFALANGGLGRDVLEGANYLAVCDRAAARCPEALAAAAAIRCVLAGDCEPAPIEYACHAPREHRWFICSIRGFRRGADCFAVISHVNITARKESETALAIAKLTAETALREADALRVTVDYFAMVSVADHAGRIISANDAFCQISGYAREELIGSDHRIMNSGTHSKAFWAEMWKSISSGNTWRADVCNRAKDGSLYWVDSVIAPFKGADGQIEKFVSIRQDVTARRQTESELRQSAERLKLAVRAGGVGIWDYDVVNHQLNWDDQMIRLYGISADQFRGAYSEWQAGVHPDDRQRGDEEIQAALRGEKEFDTEFRVVWPDQSVHFIRGIAEVFRDSHGNPIRMSGTNWDITAVKAMETELRTAARIDKLTGLPNRALLGDRLRQTVLRAKRTKDYHFALLFLDFDRFKAVNDTLGHDVGDALLQEIAKRLRTVTRSGDSLSGHDHENTSARLGGDEFVVLLDNLAKPEDALIVADRLLESFAQPFQLGEQKVHSTASIGVVTSNVSVNSADEMLRDADIAMYEAKLAGKGRYVVFNTSMRQRMETRMGMENDLRVALDGGQLFLMYQPIVSLQTGLLESFEALLRWNHPVRGLISPGEFIPIAEDTGLILPIGNWVMREACQQFAKWRLTMGDAVPRSISVNMSRNQLAQQDLPNSIKSILEQTGMEPGCLHLEVTESAVMKDPAAATLTMRAIKDLGVKLDIDDFGTGYSSLSCLHQFPIDVLKIDRSFIANIARGKDFTAMVQAVGQLARNLNITVVAEGIETVEQAMVVQALDCDFGQGYFFSRPLTAAQAAEFRVQRGLLPGMAAA